MPGELYQDPIFVFAADPLASGGIHGLGQITSPKPHYRTHPEFLQLQKEGWVGFEVLEAEIPGCEIFNLIIDVKSLTEGMGSFEHEFEQMKTVDNKQLADSLVGEYSSNNKEE